MLVMIMMFFLSGFSAEAQAAAGAMPRTHVTVYASKPIRNANYFVLGNNVQWVDKADGVYDPKSKTFNASVIEKLKKLKVFSLRFPGGTMSDTYHWKDAVGPLEQRKKGMHNGSLQESYFGTDEFLELCRTLQSGPLITVNTLTGTPEEAAEWVRYAAGRVHHWEIGNEPYLEPADKKIDPSYPDKFAQTFIEFSKAMKAADPNIKVGLPLRNNTLGRYPAGPYKNWNERMREALKYADYVCLHNTYLPSIFNAAEFKNPGSFMTLMAGDRLVREDLEETKKFLRSAVGKPFPIAITEYNSFFASPNLPESAHTSSLAAGLYTASILTDFFKDTEVIIANFWSLTGNWLFGSLGHRSQARPQYYVLQLFSDYVSQNILYSSVAGNPLFNTEAAGFMPEQKNVESLSVLASSDSGRLQVIFVNKSLQAIPCSLEIPGFDRWRKLEAVLLTGPEMQSENESSESVSLRKMNPAQFENLAEIEIPAHSVVALRLQK